MSGLITPADRITAAIEIAVKHGGHDGEHHKAWVIDQMVRVFRVAKSIEAGFHRVMR